MTSEEKILKIRSLCNIPYNSGEQWIHVMVDIDNFESGKINFAFEWKKNMGEFQFSSLDSCIKLIEAIRGDYPVNYKDMNDEGREDNLGT